jgi:TrmH family RNA methyltransferase
MIDERIEVITSFKNPRVQFVRELIASKKSREEAGAFVIEGVRLCEEAIAAGVKPQCVFTTETLSARGKSLLAKTDLNKASLFEIPLNLMEKLTATETDQGLLMVVPLQAMPMPTVIDLALIIDQVRDPGNMGTILRTAAAVGVQTVITTVGSADPFAPKVVRSAMGAHFQVPILTMTWAEIPVFCRKQQKPLEPMLAESSAGIDLWKLNMTQPLALIIGGEADGASQEARQFARQLINIPMPGGTESLNAAMAAGIILYEVVRQRSV